MSLSVEWSSSSDDDLGNGPIKFNINSLTILQVSPVRGVNFDVTPHKNPSSPPEGLKGLEIQILWGVQESQF